MKTMPPKTVRQIRQTPGKGTKTTQAQDFDDKVGARNEALAAENSVYLRVDQNEETNHQNKAPIVAGGTDPVLD